jgi:5,6,7,8-tetrahydromethanopterin hydro-lyase
VSQVEFSIEIGEGFAGAGPNAAHINTVLGLRDGPVGTAFATALAQPTAGHVPFLAVWSPNVPVEPATLFVNKATIINDSHGTLTWGAAQAGVAAGVTEYAANNLNSRIVSQLVLIVAVWVNPDADDADSVFANNQAATATALQRGAGRVTSDVDATSAISALRSGARPSNPYFATR